jgi:hypothetical protein
LVRGYEVIDEKTRLTFAVGEEQTGYVDVPAFVLGVDVGSIGEAGLGECRGIEV